MMSSKQRIVVDEVIEEHDCRGKKYVYVTDIGEEGVVKPRYALNPGYMTPQDKLALSTVDAYDEVIVEARPALGGFLDAGSYIDTTADVWSRHPICRCQEPLVSDGYNLYCRNSYCPFTLTSRLTRLARTKFFDSDLHVRMNDKEYIPMFSTDGFCEPFAIILHPEMWGTMGDTFFGGHGGTNLSVTDILFENPKLRNVSIATFLVDTLFKEFTETVYSSVKFSPYDFDCINNFYGHMVEVTQRRSPDIAWQNTILRQFLWSLGIQSLRMDVIDRMVYHEAGMGCEFNALQPYAYMLTHPGYLVQELGIHPLEAKHIVEEFALRRYEMFDIFSHYSSAADMHDAFGKHILA